MKKTTFISLLIGLSGWAQAQPSQAVLDLISKTYDPRVQVSSSNDVTTLFDICRRVEVELTAQDPVTLKPGKVKFTTFVRKFSEDRQQDLKTIVLMPPTGGVNALDWAYAGRLCANDFRVAVVTNWDLDTFNEVDMNMHDRGALRALAAVRHTIEFLQPRRTTQIGILGTSVGAITSTLAVGYESRIHAAALIVGGIGMSDIIANSDEQHLSDLRKQRMSQLHFSSVGDYQKALAEHIKIEPGEFIGFSGPKKIWMMIGTKDTTVPTPNQWMLYNTFGKPAASQQYPDNHLNTILYTSWSKAGEIVDFFEKELN